MKKNDIAEILKGLSIIGFFIGLGMFCLPFGRPLLSIPIMVGSVVLFAVGILLKK